MNHPLKLHKEHFLLPCILVISSPEIATGARWGLMLSVSVIVPSYQGETQLPALLEHFSKQVTRREWELIVVLDGSQDSSYDILKQWQDKLPLHILARKENKGRSATLNEGFFAATGDVLIRCDDDLLPETDYVEKFAKSLENNPNSGVTGLYRNIFPDNIYARIYGRKVDLRYEEEAVRFPTEQQWVLWAGNCAVSRKQWDQIGPYDENFREYGWEDVDWGYRLVQAGYSISLNPALTTPHRLAATTASIRLGRARLSGRARIKFLRKHHLPYVPKQRSAWNSVVAFTSLFAGEKWGKFLDACLHVLPHALSSKLIDIGVEAAFLRGEREALAL